MKKRIIFIVVTALLCCLLVACGSKTRLNSPENIRQEGTVLTWDEVENAEGYILFVDNAEYKTVVPSYDLSFLDKETDYVVEIMAVGDGKSFLDSDWSEFGFSCRPSEQLVPTEGLGYKLLADGSGYEVRKGSCQRRESSHTVNLRKFARQKGSRLCFRFCQRAVYWRSGWKSGD